MPTSTRPSTPPRRGILPLLLVLGLVCVPVAAFVSSGTLNYFANFDDAGSQPPDTQTWDAFGGSVVAEGPESLFEVVFPVPTDGEMKIRPNGSASDAELVCELTVPVESSTCDIGFALSVEGGFSDLGVRFDDVGDSGILDLEFTEDRHLVVEGGTPMPLPLLPGEVDLHVDITLASSMVTGQVWEITLTGPSSSAEYSGGLMVPTLSLASIHFTRASGAEGGSWILDDVLVTSADGGIVGFSTDGKSHGKH